MLNAVFVTCVAIFLGLLYCLRRDKRQTELSRDIPGPLGFPVIGNVLDVPQSGPDELTYGFKLIEKYGRLIKLWFGPILLTLMTGADDVEALLKSTKEIKKSKPYEFLHSWLGTGLLTSSGEKWFARRKAITPTFHFTILEQFTDVFNRKSSQLVDKLSELNLPAEVDVLEYATRYTLDVICETAMGVEMNAIGNAPSEYMDSFRSLCEILARRIRKPIFGIDLIWELFGDKKEERRHIKILHEQTEKIVKEKERQLLADLKNAPSELESSVQTGTKTKAALLEMLIKQKLIGNPAFRTYNDISEEVNTFMFEGHDTTTAGICFTLEMLARHPDIQDKVYNELNDVLGPAGELCHSDLHNLHYLERVIKESLRLYPSVGGIGRHLVNDLELPSGYILPAGTTIVVVMYLLHRDPKHFHNPEEFNPDNFLPEVAAKRHPYAYVPFSAGPRNCIGQKFAMLELKSVIGKLIWHFRLKTKHPVKPLVPYGSLILRSVGGHQIIFEKR